MRAAPSLWHTEPSKAAPWLSACLHRCLSGIAFGAASSAISQPVSVLSVLLEGVSLTEKFGEFPMLLGKF